MRLRCRALMLIFFSLIALQVKAGPELIELPRDVFYGEVPDRNIKKWVRLNMLGGTNYPPPIVWISPEIFERKSPDVLVALLPQEYEIFTGFVRANRCEAPTGMATRTTVQVTEYSSGTTDVACVMRKKAACDYLIGILELRQIAWTDQRAEPLYQLLDALGCPVRELKR